MPVVVNPSPAGYQTNATVASDTTGALLIAWRDSSSSASQVLIQGFDRLGHRTGRIHQANNQTYLDVDRPNLSINTNGRAVLSWMEDVGSFSRIVFRRMHVDGTPISDVLPLAGLRTIVGERPSSAIDSMGNVHLVWTAESQGAGTNIMGNFFPFKDSTGTFNADPLVHGWTGDFIITGESGNQDEPAVAVDRKGRIIVAWRDTRADSAGIWCRTYTSLGGDLGTFRLNLSPPDSIAAMTGPAVASTGLDGDVSTFTVSWLERDKQNAQILMLCKVNFDLFSAIPVVLPDTALQVRIRDAMAFVTPAISGNEDGQIALVWSEVVSGQSQLYSLLFNRYDEILPSQPVLLSSPEPGFGVPAIQPAVSVALDGSLAVVWTDTSASDPDLRMQRYNAEGQVDDPVFASPGSGSGDNRSVTFLGGQDGGYTMYWEHEDGDSLRIFRINYDIAGRPLGAQSQVTSGSAQQRRPVSAENSSGLQALAWEEYSSGSYRVMLTLLKRGGSIVHQPYAVASNTTGHLGSLAVTVSNEGMVDLLWERWSQGAGTPDLMLARFDSLGNTVGTQVTVAPATSGGGRLGSVATAPNGNMLVVWRQGASATENAHIRARVYSPTGTLLRDRIRVSRDTLEYVGSSSRPVAAASDSSGNFLVLWQEFFSSRNLLYYRLYSSNGDSLQLPGGEWRARLSSAASLEDRDRAYNSASAEVDSSGGYLVVWSEVDPTGTAGLFGQRFNHDAESIGSEFQVPGVQTAALPVIKILDQRRVAVAWQDTTGTRISFLGVQLDFHAVLGQVLLAAGGIGAGHLIVHAEGAMRDAVPAASDGSFRFDGLLGGRYRIWVSAAGVEIPGSSREINLTSGSGGVVDVGVAADLRSVPAPELPRAGSIALGQNVPNPFNPSTTVTFTVAGEQPREIKLSVYDIRGALVRSLLSGSVEPGSHRLEWDGRDSQGRAAASGVYFLRLKAGGESRVRKMILLK